MRMNNAITTLVGEELEGRDEKYRGTLAAPNGSLYGIPYYAGRVSKFNPLDKSTTEIGPDFGDTLGKWISGAITSSGIIYCPPFDEDPVDAGHGILKIDTNTDNVTELDRNLLPERDGYYMWVSCAAAHDGCIYFMPANARRIMKLDPNNNDVMTSVGDDLGDEEWKCIATVVGIDGCVYGLPRSSKRIVKYDPINDTTSFVGEEAEERFRCDGNGVLARDGCIYAATNDGRGLQIDTASNSYGLSIQLKNLGWGDAILGIDGCIYWPPENNSTCILKYDPHSNQSSLVGGDLSNRGGWSSGALAIDGVIYCLPSYANRVLAIDPIGEFLATTKANMQEHPEAFGCLFQTIHAEEDDEDDEDSALPTSLTNYDHAVLKFGHNKVFEILEKCIKPVNDYCEVSNLYPFMIAASCKESRACVINYLVRRDLSWLNGSFLGSLEVNEPKNKKRKQL